MLLAPWKILTFLATREAKGTDCIYFSIIIYPFVTMAMTIENFDVQLLFLPNECKENWSLLVENNDQANLKIRVEQCLQLLFMLMTRLAFTKFACEQAREQLYCFVCSRVK